jgi:hypothetical protein
MKDIYQVGIDWRRTATMNHIGKNDVTVSFREDT